MATPSGATYITDLPHDVIVILFNYICGTIVKSLLMETCSPYRNVVPILVKNLCIKEHDKVIFDCHNSTLIVGLNAKVNSVRELLRDCGKFIERVYFNKIHGLPKSSLIEFAELFAEHLAEQISLEFPTGHNHDLVDIFALKFKEKGVNFTTLKLLMKQGDNMGGLNHPFTADIKVLQFNTIHSRLLNSKWEIIGQSLEEVSILIGSKYGIHSGVCDRNQCIQEMKTHARKLSSISVTGLISRGLGWEESQLLDLFVSYGEQLLNLELGSMSVESYARIVDSCPKVQVALYAENNVFAGISVMAKNLCELTLEYTPYENDLSIDDVKKRVSGNAVPPGPGLAPHRKSSRLKPHRLCYLKTQVGQIIMCLPHPHLGYRRSRMCKPRTSRRFDFRGPL